MALRAQGTRAPWQEHQQLQCYYTMQPFRALGRYAQYIGTAMLCSASDHTTYNKLSMRNTVALICSIAGATTAAALPV
jgi:hypothetical protein